jgi:asparagine synthase (glutamine-hydrolysing)
MCGIFGYNIHHSAQVANYFKALAHRGPDAQATTIAGVWTLGHLRLSIIDTSNGANQPYERDGNWIIFNGEIYNYLELKEKYLKNVTLKTHSDTEVLIELLNRRGLSVLSEVNGMFAFGWYDGHSATLYLVRDRFGVKPLYFTATGSRFAFASEIKPLATELSRRSLDPVVMDHFFRETATDFDERSGLKGVLQVRPGHYLTVAADGTAVATRWYHGTDFTVDPEIFTDAIATRERFAEILTDALSLRHRSDVPICLTLSGGLDSTTLYVLAKERLGSHIRPFVFAHPGALTDESPRATSLAQYYGDDPIVVKSTPNEHIVKLATALRHLEFPMWNPSAVAYLDMYSAIKQHGFKVVIEGHGSDEQLGGYPYLVEAAWKETLLKGDIAFARTLYRTWRETQNQALGQPSGDTGTLAEISGMSRGLARGLFKAALWPDKWKYLDFTALVRESFDYKILPIVLRTFDRLSMSQSLESRCPFMDYRVVEFLRAMPLRHKVNAIGSKAILREILKQYGHTEIYTQRAKMGFASDIPALLNAPANRAFFVEAVTAFEHPAYASYKERAVRRLKKATLGWEDVTDIWKIAAITLTQRLYDIS